MDAVSMSSSYISTGILYPLILIIGVLLAVHYWMESLRIVQMGKKLPGKECLLLNRLEIFTFKLNSNQFQHFGF